MDGHSNVAQDYMGPGGLEGLERIEHASGNRHFRPSFFQIQADDL